MRPIEPSNHQTIRLSDSAFMRHALSLACRNLGQTWPNPAVGAVAVKNGIVIGTGWTARGGRPHAEPQALAQARGDVRGATLYITLEPCPACAEAILAAGVARVVYACADPHPKAAGKGVAALKAAGIEITQGVLCQQAEALNEGFFSVIRHGRPFVALKTATSLDGHILPGDGAPRWITGEAARAHGHLLRSRYDAILTGSGTVLADNPQLTCRLPGLEDRTPQRIVLDRRGRIPQTARVLPAWVERETEHLETLMKSLAMRGVTRLLVEAGPTLNAALLKAGLVDRIYWFRSPEAAEGLSAFPGGVPEARLESTLALGRDQLEIYACSPGL